MAVAVKKITLWRKEVDNRPGVLAATLGPLAEAGANLRVAMGYRFPGNESRGAIEVYPISGKKLTAATRGTGWACRDSHAAGRRRRPRGSWARHSKGDE